MQPPTALPAPPSLAAFIFAEYVGGLFEKLPRFGHTSLAALRWSHDVGRAAMVSKKLPPKTRRPRFHIVGLALMVSQLPPDLSHAHTIPPPPRKPPFGLISLQPPQWSHNALPTSYTLTLYHTDPDSRPRSHIATAAPMVSQCSPDLSRAHTLPQPPRQPPSVSYHHSRLSGLITTPHFHPFTLSHRPDSPARHPKTPL